MTNFFAQVKRSLNEMTYMEKVMRRIKNLLSVIIGVLGIFQIFRIVNYTIDYIVPLLGVYKCIEAYEKWDEDRDLASIDILLAILIFAVTFIIWFTI